ncbi:MAG: glycosyltransferase [Bacteriovoracaceae bacterium]
MKILQLSKYYEPVNGGIELVAKLMTKAFREDNHEVRVVAFSDNEGERIGRYGEKIWEIKQNLFFLSTPFSYRFYFSFKKILEAESFDQIYIHLPNPFMHEILKSAQQILKRTNTKVIGVYHSDIVNKGFLGSLYDRFFLRHQHLYDNFLCSSPKLRESSHVLQKVVFSKIKVIPFCVEENNHFRIRENFTKELVAIGRFVPYKGFEFLLKALQGTDYRLTLMGSGPLYKKLKQFEGPNLRLVGDVTEEVKNLYLNLADVLIVSSNSRAEAYGMTIVEAFHRGLPVVASNLPTGVTFLVNDEVTGLIFDIENRQSLLDSLKKLENDPLLMKKLSQQCYQFYHDQLRFKLFKEKLLALQN